MRNKQIQLLANKMLNNDQFSKQSIIAHYINFIKEYVDKNYSDSNYEKADLYQAGMVGLIITINNYSKATKSSFALLVNKNIKSYIDLQIEEFNNLANVDLIGLNNDYYKTEYNDSIMNIDSNMSIDSDFDFLNEKTKDIMFSHILDKTTFDKLGEKYNVSRQAVQQVYENGINKVKQKLK